MREFTDLQGLAVGQVWEHKNGNIYEIYDFTNLEAGRQDEYPTTVSYRNIHTGAPYSRALVRWAGSFKRRQDLEKGPAQDFDVELHYLVDNDEHIVKSSIKAANGSEALALVRSDLLIRKPKARVFWANVTSGVVAQVKAIDNG
ncbi:hypothetical protein [Sinorhizobium meliloti]|uniref:hypothetical protein n=1 Tax=Rhizobium meliloti TaxID=382 RepID=UPI0012961FDF|nr:hypothetical protein [Sinorhizobium meliloti]MDW9491736.1 hypothetical protein [Sinorhizobium meliloti]MQV03002.1 hypothetical protein [Sinorhizobium meliloti]